ncbi:GNAT family N-acetyltransferase [Flavobacterium sp.]|uniref:GNAT family N-acetyltransferase n=1 Tax=Flavobacterium sp. TaxID=239 RepID=UPI003D0AF015
MESFSFLPFQNLESTRLLLRQMNYSDVDGVFALRGNPENMKYIPRPLLKSRVEAMELIDTINQKIEKNEGINWAIIEKSSGVFIGFLGHYRIQWAHSRSEIGYMFLPEAQGKGYATEAVELIVKYGFEQMKMHSLEAVIDPANTGSARVLEKNHFVKEAHIRENEFFEGKYWDSVIYSLLKKDL